MYIRRIGDGIGADIGIGASLVVMKYPVTLSKEGHFPFLVEYL